MRFKLFLESVSEDNNAVLVVNTDAKFAEKIIDGVKTIETRGIKIPDEFNRVPIELVTKIKGKKVSLGKVIFKGYEIYTKDKEGLMKWERDRQKHLVPKGTSFDLPVRTSDRPRYGWIVDTVEKYEQPKEFPFPFTMSGIRKIK